MRKSIKAMDTNALAWESLSPVMSRKVLNGDPESGPHTMLLRSEPREPDIDFAQYHPIDEEFFCLEGDFTFDGSTWFREGSYAYYPAYFVHGTNVNVRGGYLVYLRLSGPNELIKLHDPKSDAPYYVGEGEPDAKALQLADAAAALARSESVGASGARATALHRAPGTGCGSTLLTVPAAAADQLIEVEAGGTLELFTVSGNFRLEGGETLGARAYHCEAGDRPTLKLRCLDAGDLLISHDGPLQLTGGGAANP